MQRLWTLVPGHLSSHSALSSYGLSMPLTLWQLFVSLRPLIQTQESCPASGAPWSSAMPPSLGRGRVINNIRNQNTISRLSRLAVGILFILSSSSPSKRAFSVVGNIAIKRQNELSSSSVDALVALNSYSSCKMYLLFFSCYTVF